MIISYDSSDMPDVYKTKRLVIRSWCDADLPYFAKINADPEVMRYVGEPLVQDMSDAFAGRIRKHFDDHGFGLWAIERRDEPGFIGFVGLMHVSFEAPFTPAIEIGWRLAGDQWGKGYATEAANEVLRIGFEQLALSEIVAFTYEKNLASRRVMEKIAMKRDPEDDFAHPKLPEGYPLRPHVLYRIRRV